MPCWWYHLLASRSPQPPAVERVACSYSHPRSPIWLLSILLKLTTYLNLGIKKNAKLILAGDSRKTHSTHFTLKENGRKILRGMGHLCFQLQECHLAESLMASKRDIAKGQYVPDMSALAGAMRSRRSWIKEAKTNNCGGGGQSLLLLQKICGRSFGICSFPPPEPTTCNEIDPATQFGFSNDPDHITRIQILIFPAYCTENSPLLIGGESVRMIILIICTKMLEIRGRNIWVFWPCYCNFVPQDPIVLDLRSRKMIDKLTWLRSKILLILWYILCWTQRPTATEEIGWRNLSTAGRNCKRAERKLCSPPKKKCWKELQVKKGPRNLCSQKSVLGGIAGAKKGNCVPCPKTVYLQKLPLHKIHSNWTSSSLPFTR